MDTTTLQKLGVEIATRKQAREDAYFALARALAEGRKVQPDKVETVLQEVGKPFAELEAAVTGYTTRLRLAAEIANKPGLQQEAADLSRKIKAADEILAEAQRARDAVVDPLAYRNAEIADALTAIGNAAGELAKTPVDPRPGEALQTIRAEIDAVNAKIAELAQARDSRLAGAARVDIVGEDVAAGFIPLTASPTQDAANSPAGCKARAEKLRAEAARFDGLIGEERVKLAALEEARKAAEAALMVP